MGLTLAQRFGSSATIITSSQTVSASTDSPKLIIDLSDFENVSTGGDIANSQGIDDVSAINDSTKDVWADKIAAAQIVLWKQQQPTDNTDDTIGVYLDDSYKQFVTRDVEEQLAYVYPVNIYVPDPTGAIDPDDVV